MKILHVVSHSGVEERLRRQFSKIGWVAFESGMRDYEHYDAVFVLEPFECLGQEERLGLSGRGGLYTSVFLLWKRFLAFHYPEVKLLVGGFARTDHPNYLNLLSLSDETDLKALIREAQPVAEQWEEQMPKRGEDILDKLALFFEGHHQEGIIVTLAKVRQGLNHAYYDYGISEVSLGKFRNIWENQLVPIRTFAKLMQRRWRSYAPLFENMPFYYQLTEVGIDQYLDDLKQVLEGRARLSDQQLREKQRAFAEFDGFNRLDQLQKALDLVNKRYITLEIIGDLLAIDDDPTFHQKLVNSFPVFRFKHAYSGKEGLQRAGEKDYDAILLDLQLDRSVQELTGLNYIRSLKGLQPETPLIVVTTHAHPKVYAEAIELGADNFLVKNDYDIRQWESIFIRTISGKPLEPPPVTLNHGKTPIEQADGLAQVLIIEDDEDWYKKIGAMPGGDLQFHWAPTQQVALDLIRDPKYDFDLILMDLYLRSSDETVKLVGLKIIPVLIRENPVVPIIVTTRNWRYSMALEAINQGASDYLRKDQFNAQLWHNRFKNYIELKKQRELIEKMINM